MNGTDDDRAADRAELPRQARGRATATAPASARTAVPAGPEQVADAAATENLLRCWVRENDIPRPAQDTLRVALHATGTALHVPVHYWSDTGRHRFGAPVPENAPPGCAPLDAVTLAALISREASHCAARTTTAATQVTETDSGVAAPPHGAAASAESTGLVGRVADSVERTAAFLAARTAAPEPPSPVSSFLDAEQSLVLGHPLHPSPKARQGLSEAECRVYSPELRGAFQLHWMAVDQSVLARDSAWTERGRTVTGDQLAMRLAGDAASRLPAGTVPLPLHPWQARQLPHRPAVSRLLADGLLHDLGPTGDLWHPTSSVRTVVRPDGPAMLKLSLDLPITNSRRENLRKELLRGLEVHRLLRAGLSAQWRAAHPGFDIVRDPAWLGVDGPDGRPVPGLDTVIRHNPFGATDDAVCVAGLISPRPSREADGGTVMRSRLTGIVERLSATTGRPVAAVATEWFLRYLDAVVRPVLWFDANAGIALEAHQQNTLVLLDSDGWPKGGRYRDNQGYYFRSSRREELQQRMPGARLGVASDSFVADAVVDERFAYYLGVNNVFGLIGALGEQQLAAEQVLLAAFRRFLRTEAAGEDGEPRSTLPALLLDAPTLRCKANLLTRLHGMDELVGPVDTQSVYVTVTNPLAG
ncbi:IucA/IucC family protein [Streptomyces ovatisporus]|uniref:IucA/IucC family protein n=1 Tax=Streptomyces ovatisporus TaxID=1128682 RepID=A0ABV9AHE1_9ACTN